MNEKQIQIKAITDQQGLTIAVRKAIETAETNLKALSQSRARALALTKIQEARMWLSEDERALTRELATVMGTNNA